MKNIRVVLLLSLFASPVLAQDDAASARAAAGCGPAQVNFDVKTDKNQHPSPKPEAGKALIFVIEDAKTNDLGFRIGGITTKVGLDGAWIGANQNQSYFFYSVDPGDHRLCANWQSSIGSRARVGAAASFTADANKVYYFRTKIYVLTDEKDSRPPMMKLERIDPAEAQLLISSASLSTSHPKK